MTCGEDVMARLSLPGKRRMADAPMEESLSQACLLEGAVSAEIRGDPPPQALALEDRAVCRIVDAHAEQRVGESLLQVGFEIDARREHAVGIRRRGPDDGERAGGGEALPLDARPEWTPHRACVRSSVQHGAEHVDLAGARVAMLADVGVE